MLSNNFKFFFKKFFIIIIIIVYFIVFNIENYKKKKYNSDLLLKINNFEKRNNITQLDIKEFRRINTQNILLDKKNNTKVEDPIISIILLVYNQFHCIHKSIRSIQNQSIKNLEIIVVDDCSSDNSVELIKKYQKEDNRITIIEHTQNEGKIKSRSDGIRIAKGKYITLLDGDDALIHKDILKNSLYISNLGNLDVVEFKIIYFRGGEMKYCCNQYPIEVNNIIYQPKLRTKFFFFDNNFRYRAIQNRSICAKIIKNEIFKKVLSLVGPKYTEDYILSYEDTIFAAALFQIANSYYFFKQEGYYYSRDEKRKKLPPKKISKPNREIIKGLDCIKLLQFLIEKTRNIKIERQLIYYEIMSINYYWNFYKNINHHFKMVFNIFDKMIKSRFLKKGQKHVLILMKHSLERKGNHLLKI
jgi:glycosyltransferase involved in cell wall biosynthesis